ncbi:MAG: YHYH domain-containing protein [Myxococcales bacterium]|nr:YHYH domain-containing protein [Myxococcales bacterium]MCB9609053.1 YHYH domain-containing protein [Polyangiaceae bacterium]
MGRLLLVLLTLLPSSALAHRGGLDDNGGHHDRRTGEYHCHHASCRQAQREQEDGEDRRRGVDRERGDGPEGDT